MYVIIKWNVYNSQGKSSKSRHLFAIPDIYLQFHEENFSKAHMHIYIYYDNIERKRQCL